MAQQATKEDRDDMTQTVVVFRVMQGEVTALFPECDYGQGLCYCYAHVGQHSSADYTHCIRASRPATPEEYAPLQRELEGAPYHYRLIVRERYTRLRG